MALIVKNLPANAGDIKGVGLIPGSGRTLEECMATHSSGFLENPMDRGAWQATVHGYPSIHHEEAKRILTSHTHPSSLGPGGHLLIISPTQLQQSLLIFARGVVLGRKPEGKVTSHPALGSSQTRRGGPA